MVTQLGSFATDVRQGQVFDKSVIRSLEQMVTLVAACVINNPWATFRKYGTQSGYQVPTGKKFILLGVRVSATGGTGTVVNVEYSDEDVGFNSSSAPATRQYTGTGPVALMYSTQNVSSNRSVLHVFPAGKFISFRLDAGTTWAHAFGYEILASDKIISEDSF